MNEEDQLVLYMDASTKAINGVLMQVQAEIEKPCVFVSHCLSEQALKWELWSLNFTPSFTASSIYLPTCWENNLLSETITKTWCIWLIQRSRNW